MTKPLLPRTLATLAVPFYPIPRVFLAIDREERGCCITTSQLAEILYPGITFDSTLPQLWVDDWAAKGIEVRGHFVWGYPYDSALGGIPLPLIVDTWEWMLKMLPPDSPGVERTALHWLKLRRAEGSNRNLAGTDTDTDTENNQ